MVVMPRRPWNRNIHYHDLVLNAVPPGCRRALDVGCGGGRLASELAERCGAVTAIDVDAPTLARAKLAHARRNLSFVEGDVMTHPFEPGSFDFIAAVASLHHLPLEPTLARFARLLGPGGVLAIVGLYRLQTLTDWAYAPFAMSVSWWLRLTNRYERVEAPIRDSAETLAEIERCAARALPGSQCERQLLFRYSLVWRKAGLMDAATCLPPHVGAAAAARRRL
jgi:SAM-dependent methyltransferase